MFAPWSLLLCPEDTFFKNIFQPRGNIFRLLQRGLVLSA